MTYQGQAGTPSTGTDPAYVPDREVFDAYTHQQIWDLARERLAPAELRRVADAWGHTADALESAFDEHARELTRLSGEWSGIAAGAAAQAATALVQAGDDTVGVCRVLRQLMTANSDAAESVRTAIPPPPAPYRPDPDAAVEAATGAQRRTAHNLATAAATATAQDAMTFGYNPTIPASGDSVPRFPAVVATTPESPGVPAVTERGPAPGTGPGTTVGAAPEAPENEPPGSTTAHTDEDTAPVTWPGRAGDGPQPTPGNASAPTPIAPENASQPAGIPSDPSPEAGSPDHPVPQGESPQPDNTAAAGSPQHSDAPAADTAPAAASVPDTHHARSEPAAQPSSAPVDRGTGPVAGAGVTDLSPRSPASPPTTGPTAPIPPAPSAAAPFPAVPGPAGPAPAGPVPPTPPGATGGGAAPGHSTSTGGTSGPTHGPGTATPQHRPAPGIQPTFTGAPVAVPGTPPAYAPGVTAPASGTPATTGNEGSPDGTGNSESIAQAPPCGVGTEGPSRTGPGTAAYDGPATTPSTSSEGAAPSGSESAGTTRAGVPCPGWSDSPSRIDCGNPPHTESNGVTPSDSQNQACTGPGTAGPDAPVVIAPTTSGSTAAPAPAAVPHFPDPSVRTPAGHTDPMVHPPLPREREALGPAGTGSNDSTADGHEHPGQRPVRLVPAGMPLPSGAGVPLSRPADSERTSPDYLHAPNEALTATDPRVPPVLGEYTEPERAERDDPGGGSR